MATLGTPGVSSQTVNSNNHDIVLPASYSPGDMLLMVIACDGQQSPALSAFWSILDTDQNGVLHRHLIAWGVADGTEDDDLVWETGATEQSTTVVYPVIGADTSTPPELAGAASQGTDAAPDPPAVSPSWGAEADTLFVIAITNDSNITVSAFPTNYTDNGANHGDSSTGGARAGVSWRNANTATEDPGAGTLSAAEEWIANTIAIRTAVVAPEGPFAMLRPAVMVP